MATRSCIAYGTKDKWFGTYHHWVGIPEGLGNILYQQLVGKSREEVYEFVIKVVFGHPSGYSTFESPEENTCYCHDRNEPDAIRVINNFDWRVIDTDVEYAYVIDADNMRFHVLINYGNLKETYYLEQYDPEWRKYDPIEYKS